jgi:Putative adhesin
MNGDTAMTTPLTTGPVTRPPRAPAALTMTSGRWITLMIGVPIALALIAWTGFSLLSALGQAHYPVSTTIPLLNGQLAATVNGGDVTLRQDQAQGSTARLTGTVQYTLVRPRFSVTGTDVSLDCHIPTGNCGFSATLGVPANTPVDLSSGGGNVQASGIQRDVTLDTAGGDVALSGIGGNADLSTGGGNVNAGDLGGIVNFTTAGGDVAVNDLFSPHVELQTGGGNVTLTFTKAPAYLNITSSGGDVSVVVPHGGTEYAITATTDGGGYSAPVPANAAASAHTIKIDSGGGNVSITEAG